MVGHEGGPARPPITVTTAAPDTSGLEAETHGLLAALVDHPPGLILTPSCSTALEIAAELLALSPGDEVIVPSFTHPSTANGFVARGARIRIADIAADTLDVDPASVEALRSDRTVAIVPVHYAGVGADMAAISAIAAAVGATVVEDAAQGLFGRIDGVPLGRLGALGCLSFHRTKNISAVAGGALLVNDPALVERAVVVADKGTDVARFAAGDVDRYEWAGIGIDGRMAAPAMAVLNAQLRDASVVQARRAEVWARYASELADWAVASGTRLPVVPAGRTHPAHLFHLVLADTSTRDRFVKWCAARSVQAVRHFVALSDSRFGAALAGGPGTCPVASDVAERLVRIPLHHALSDDDVDRVVEAVTSFPI